MPPLRALSSAVARPTISDLHTFLFSPPLRTPTCLYANRRAFSSHNRLCATSRISRPNLSPNFPRTRDRGPASTEDTQTDFGSMNVLGSMPAPSTSIDACVWDGFHLNSGVKIDGGKGALLVSGEAFGWSPWSSDKRVFNQKGQFEIGDDAWGVLDLVWPKPDLLIIGMGKEVRPLSRETRRYLGGLGIRVEVADTRNASAQFNLLATERGTGNVAAALIPVGWKDGVGCV